MQVEVSVYKEQGVQEIHVFMAFDRCRCKGAGYPVEFPVKDNKFLAFDAKNLLSRDFFPISYNGSPNEPARIHFIVPHKNLHNARADLGFLAKDLAVALDKWLEERELEVGWHNKMLEPIDKSFVIDTTVKHEEDRGAF